MPLATLLLVPVILVGPAADAAPPTAAELDALLARMAGPDARDRLAAAGALEHGPASGYDVYVARLRRPRATRPETYRTLILEAWGQVPNPSYLKDGQLWTRKPEPPWKPPPRTGDRKGEPRPRRPPPHDPETTEWLAALAGLDLEGNPVLAALPDRAAARAEAMEVVALLRALSATGRTDAVEPLFDFAFELDGVFRDECGRTIRALGSQAIPGLIRRKHAPINPSEAVLGYRRRRYAGYQLDRMDRAQPQKAIAGAPDDRSRALLLHAYGEVRAIDAVDAILGQVDAASHMVRKEARWAWLRYVTGPPPPPPPKRHRKLPGGAQESAEKEDYLSHRELALLALVKKLAEIHGDPDCATCPRDADKQIKIPTKGDAAERMTRELLDHYDQLRGATWDADFDAARARAAAGDLDGAIAGFSAILAHDPLYGRRGEVAGTFYLRGEALLDGGERERGIALLREAVVLDGGSDRARRTDARLRMLDGQRRLAEGIDASDDFRRALELDPGNAEAKAALASMESWASMRRRVQESVVAAGGLALLLLAVALWKLLRAPGPGPTTLG